MEDNKRIFNEHLREIMSREDKNTRICTSKLVSKAKYERVKNCCEGKCFVSTDRLSGPPNNARFKAWVRHKGFFTKENVETKTVEVFLKINDKELMVVSTEAAFEVIGRLHALNGIHQNERSTFKLVQEAYYGITLGMIKTFIELCPNCPWKKSKSQSSDQQMSFNEEIVPLPEIVPVLSPHIPAAHPYFIRPRLQPVAHNLTGGKQIHPNKTEEQQKGKQKNYIMHIKPDVFQQWKTIGKTKGLATNSDIAQLLIDCYESHCRKQSGALCVKCQGPLTLVCTKCSHQAESFPKQGYACLKTSLSLGSEICLNKSVALIPESGEKYCSGCNSDHMNSAKPNTECNFTLNPTKHSTECNFTSLNPVKHSNGCHYDSLNHSAQDLSLLPWSSDGDKISDVEMEIKQNALVKRKELYEDLNTDLFNLPKHKPNSEHTSKCITSKEMRFKRSPYKCCLSNNIFVQRDLFATHLHQHSIEKSYKCSQCDKIFTSSVQLKRHKQLHTGQRPHKCEKCGKDFKLLCQWTVHKRIHTGERPFTCHMCSRTFITSTHLGAHMRTHTGQKPYKCDQCGKSFSLSGSLLIHKRVHTGERPYKCKVCGKGFAQSGNLTSHLRSHSGEKPFLCNLCGKAFSESGCLAKHLRRHSGQKPFVCHQCGKTFTHGENLKKHMRIHTGEQPYACEQCGEKFMWYVKWKTHMDMHTGMSAYPCQECGKKYSHAYRLAEHMRVHSGQKPYICNVCGKSFTWSGQLTVHRRIHTKEKPYKCSVCNKAFAQSGNMSAHMRTHYGERPYICKDCGKAFTESGALSRHIRIHIGEKRHVCQQCGKAFIELDYLSKHMRLHTGHNPYSCKSCDQTFRWWHQWKKHSQKHADNRSSNTGTC